MPGHEAATQTDVARRIANIQGFGFAGAYDAHRTYEGRLFFVPDDVLLDVQARQLGITSDDDLFGGVVPYDFVKTKAIARGLIRPGAARPLGWSTAFSARTRDVVLPGYTVFSREDALKLMRNEAGRTFDPTILAVFLGMIDLFDSQIAEVGSRAVSVRGVGTAVTDGLPEHSYAFGARTPTEV